MYVQHVHSVDPRRSGWEANLPASAPSRITNADELTAAWLLGYGPATRAAYGADLRDWRAWLAGYAIPVLDAHRAHVDAYARTLERNGAAAATVARRLSTLAGYYGYAADEELIPRSPVARVRRPKVTDASPRLGLSREELALLLGAAAHGARDHALACLLGLNGLRVSEALGADAPDLSTERGHRTLAIVRKGGRRALVPLAPRTSASIDAMLKGRDTGPLFATRTGARMDRHAAGKVIRRLARQAGISKAISPHSLRHSFVTVALDAGASLRDVQDAAGHADPRTTRAYDRGRHSLDRHPTYAVAVQVSCTDSPTTRGEDQPCRSPR